MFVIFGILFTGCIVIASPYSFDPPSSLLRVERKWYVSPSAKIGSQVAKVLRDKNGDKNVTYALYTNGSPVPFEIDPHDGIVRVNDTLADKENQTYSLWVTMEGAPIFQRLEIFAIITDDAGYKPTLSFPHANTDRSPIDNTISITNTTAKNDKVPNVPDSTTSTTIQNPSKVPEIVTNSSNTSQISDYNKNMTIFEPNKESNILLAIIPPVAIGGLVLIVAAVVIFVWKKNNGKKWKKDKKDDMNKESSGIVLQDASLNLWDRPRAYSNRYESWDTNHLQLSEETTIEKENPYDEWEFPRHRLRMFNIVGEGAFGQVFRAQAVDIDGKKGDTTVAVKTLKENASPEEKNDLLQELNVMKSLGTHPNVVRLIGCCTEKEPTLVIMEFVSLGKLQQFLRDSRAERHYGNTHADSSFLTSSDLTHFAYQVARGMDFLSSKGIIHRDLAARNILITEERMCKVADFGFARDVADTDVYERKSGGRLPIRWMAPESLYDNIFSVKSDIWSFGVLLWEIVTLGSTPYPGLSAGDVMQKVRDGHRLEKPEHCRREFYNIMYYCWEAEPSARPDFKEVVAMLERLLCTETDYIELERFPDHSYYNVQHLDGEKL